MERSAKRTSPAGPSRTSDSWSLCWWRPALAAARAIFVIAREYRFRTARETLYESLAREILCNDLVRNEEKTERYSISVSFDLICPHAHPRSAIRVTSGRWPATFFSACPKDEFPGISQRQPSVAYTRFSCVPFPARYSRSPADAWPKIFYVTNYVTACLLPTRFQWKKPRLLCPPSSSTAQNGIKRCFRINGGFGAVGGKETTKSDGRFARRSIARVTVAAVVVVDYSYTSVWNQQPGRPCRNRTVVCVQIPLWRRWRLIRYGQQQCTRFTSCSFGDRIRNVRSAPCSRHRPDIVRETRLYTMDCYGEF